MSHSDRLLLLACFNIATTLLAYLFKGWVKEACLFMWSDLSAKAEYCKKHKPFGIWRAFNRVFMTLAVTKWVITCVVLDGYIIYNLITGAPLFG